MAGIVTRGVTTGCRSRGEVLLDFPRAESGHQTAVLCEAGPRKEWKFAVPGLEMDPLLVGFVCVNPLLGSAVDSLFRLNQPGFLTRFEGRIILQEISGN